MKAQKHRWSRVTARVTASVTWGVAVIGLSILTVGSLQSAPRTDTATRSIGEERFSETATSPKATLSPSDWAGIREAHDRYRHQVVSVPGQDAVWQARNPGQQWVTRFDTRGFLVEPADGGVDPGASN